MLSSTFTVLFRCMFSVCISLHAWKNFVFSFSEDTAEYDCDFFRNTVLAEDGEMLSRAENEMRNRGMSTNDRERENGKRVGKK